MLPLWFRQTDFRKTEKTCRQYRLLPEGVQLKIAADLPSQSSGSEVTVNVPQGGIHKIGPFFEQTSLIIPR